MPRGNQTPPTTISPLTRAELANLRLKAGVAQQTAEEAAANSQPLDADLTAISALTGTGLAARIADDTWALRTLQAPASGLTITNPGGVAGNPAFALANDLAALEALSGTNTIYYRSGVDTWSPVTIAADLGFVGGTLGSALAAALAAKVDDSQVSAFALTLLDDIDANAARNTLDLGAGDSVTFSSVLVGDFAFGLSIGSASIQSLNSGSPASLHLNPEGGSVIIGGSTVAALAFQGDGDKGDITVSGSTWTVDDDAITYPKMQNVSATDKLLGRSSAGAGNVEEITCTAAGRSLLDDANAAAQRVTLAAAGTGDANTFTAQQTITAQAVASTRETVLKGTVSDAGNDAFFISNFTSIDARFQPALTGFTDTVDNVASLAISGMIMSARDVTGDAGLGIVNVRAAITSSATDPNNGTLTAITNRTLFSVSNQATRVFGVTPAGANVGSGFAYHVNGTKVLGAQGAAVANATDAASVITQLNALLARCRAHGLIAT